MSEENEALEEVMEGVREYAEDDPVTLEFEGPKDFSKIPEGGRWVVRARNEGGFNCTQVDVLDLLKWLRENRPDLLKLEE